MRGSILERGDILGKFRTKIPKSSMRSSNSDFAGFRFYTYKISKIPKTKMCCGTFWASMIFWPLLLPNQQILLDLDSAPHKYQKAMWNPWSKPKLSTEKWPPKLPKLAIWFFSQISKNSKPKCASGHSEQLWFFAHITMTSKKMGAEPFQSVVSVIIL